MNTKEHPFTHAGRTLWFTEGTPEEVQRILCEMCHAWRRVRLYLGDPKSGLIWPEEHDVLGYIGCSPGPVKVPLLLHNSRSKGGGAILTHCVLGIDRAVGLRLYRHRDFHHGAWTMNRSKDARVPWAVLQDGKTIAQFKTQRQAEYYRLFMLGRRWAK